MGQIPGGGVSVRYGAARWDGTQWLIDDNGSYLPADWLDPIQPVQAGPIAYLLVTDGYGQSSALVLGGITKQPRPGTGTVQDITAGGTATTITVLADDNNTYVTSRFIGSYNLGDPVLLDWTAGVPTVLGKIAEMTITPDAAITQPAATKTGTATLTATASDTWSVNGWGTWAGSTNGREKVYSGTQSGYTVTGSWFYGPWGTSLAGLTIREARFRVPARLSGVGTSGAVTINLYAHTSQSRPGGDVTRTEGPFAVTLPPGYDPGRDVLNPALPPGWVVLPSSFHAVLQSGGGVSIAGGGYVGLNGRLDDGASGQIDIDWSTA
jgi:hypothetical protein